MHLLPCRRRRRPAVPFLAALLAAASLPAQYRYQQQTGLIAGPTVRTEGCLLVDVDGDGDLDVVFANGYVLSTSGQAIQPTLLINRIGQGLGLVDETAARLPALAIRGTLAVAFDVDGDGDLDLVFACNGNSQQRLYVNDGAGHFTDESTTRLPGMVITAAGCAYGDVDQDGDLDLFFNDELTNGQLKLCLNDGTGTFTNVTGTHVVAAPKSNQQDIVLCDLDNDWDLDVINCGKSAGQQIFFNDGTGRFLTVTTALLPAGTTLTYEFEAADLDHDGDLDLAMLSYSGVTDTLLRNELIPSGTLSFTNLPGALAGGAGDDDNEWAFVDCDDDGDLDLVNGSLQAAAEKLYRNDGGFTFTRWTGTDGFSPQTDSTLDVAIGDLNGDGVFDVVTAQGESGTYTNRAYYGTGPADTQPPRFVRVESLPAVSQTPDGPWVVRAAIQDSFVDDGETSVQTAALDWTITHRGGVAIGSTPMRFLGGLLFRAELHAPPGVIMNGATVVWSLRATDRRGNTAVTPAQSFWICGIQAYGLALGGTNTALLAGGGDAHLGGLFALAWSQAGPSTTGALGISLGSRWQATIPEGTLLIDPYQFLLVGAIGTDPAGAGGLGIPIPNLPLAGLPVTFQAVFDVPVSMTNGVELVLCP
ncbi:MAG: VCBS repeat-containing protein [Planctomycetes bacterium]|nr:VCBS repeat-containing protein [Planctomycetota bacterium]